MTLLSKRPHESRSSRSFKLGDVSVVRLQARFSDPTVMNAEKQPRQAGAELGADAVIVRNTRGNDAWAIYVDGEAIRYTD